jgi:hypothetical protein
VQPWCTVAEVNNLVAGDPSVELLTEYAAHATSYLYTQSGRRFAGEATVIASFEIDRRGYVRLTAWLPVRDVTAATIGSVAVPFNLSPAGTYVEFPLSYRGRIVELTLEVGQNPPPIGRSAAAALAAEMLRGDPRYAALNAGDTRPDARLTSITRQGVTMEFVDPEALFRTGMTGVYAVDLFLRATNPTGARYQAKVITP